MATEFKLSYTANEINERLGKVDEIDALKQNAFSGNYNDLKNAPNISEDGSGELYIVDKNGNIIFCVDKNGVSSTAFTSNGEDIVGKISSHTGNTSVHITSSEKQKLASIPNNISSLIDTKINEAIGNVIAASY